MDSRDQLINEVSNALEQLKLALHVYATESFEQTGLSLTQLGLLRRIALLQPVSQTTLAKQMQLTPGAISQLIDTLEHAKCIIRTADQNDRRVSQLSASRHGMHLLREFNNLAKRLLTDSLSSVSDEDIKTYIRIQYSIAAWLESQRPTSCTKH